MFQRLGFMVCLSFLSVTLAGQGVFAQMEEPAEALNEEPQEVLSEEPEAVRSEEPAGASAEALSEDLNVDPEEQTGEERTFILKDGSIVKGTVLEEGDDHYRVATTFGEVRLNKADLKKTNVRLTLSDGSTVVGVLLEETEEAYRVDSKMGVLTIAKADVTSFEVNVGKKKEAAAKGTPGLLPTPGKRQEGESFSHAIEPLIDIFFDPTGYTFRKGDIYVSGLSIGYGLSDDWLMSVNVVNLVGFFGGEINPNLELKYNLYENRDKDTETFISMGMRGQLLGHLGDSEIQYRQDRKFEREGDNSWCSDGDSSEPSRKTVRKWRKNDPRDEDHEDHDNHVMAEMSPSGQQDCESRIVRDYEEERGWSTQLYLATTFSRLMDRGGRMSLHFGGIVEMNALHTQEDWKWTDRPSFRLYGAFDLDVSRDFKILGELFYDPDYFSITRNHPKVGVDVGLMWAYSETLRFLVHLDIPFVGIYWRF